MSLIQEHSLDVCRKNIRPITDDEIAVLKRIRGNNGHGTAVSRRKNVAYSHGTISAERINLQCVSGKNGWTNFKKIDSELYFYRGIYGESFINHTEQDNIEYLYDKYKYNTNAEGYLTIVSEGYFCPNCISIIEQFMEDFPNIKVTLVFDRIRSVY